MDSVRPLPIDRDKLAGIQIRYNRLDNHKLLFTLLNDTLLSFNQSHHPVSTQITSYYRC